MNSTELRSRRKALGITQQEAAELLGIAFQTYNTYENKAKLTRAKVVLIERVFSDLEKKNIDSVSEERSEYKKSDKNEDILQLIFAEVQDIRKKNEQLNETITQMQQDRNDERKVNDLLRKQLQLAINVLKNLDIELHEREKSSGTEENISKMK